MKRIFLLLLPALLIASTGIAQDQDRVKKQDRIHLEDHIRLKDGSCLLVKQGVESRLQEAITLNNGTIVNPDGTYQLRNQQRYQLRNGECLDMNGNRFLNQNRYNKRRMMTDKKIEKIRTRAVNKNRPGNSQGSRRGNSN